MYNMYLYMCTSEQSQEADEEEDEEPLALNQDALLGGGSGGPASIQ